jgi:hypothetical protein
MEGTWTSFVQNAPREWLSDEFLTSRVPISVSSRYGQNRALNFDDEAAEVWERERDYSHIRYMSIALATHIRCVLSFAMDDENNGIFTIIL